MTKDRVAALIDLTGLRRQHIAKLLGYRSENSLRQAMAGTQALPPDKAAWLEGYAALRSRLAREEAAWLARHPAPGQPPAAPQS